MADINEISRIFANQIGEAKDNGIGQFRANALVNIATLSLLIDAGIITEEAAISRIEEIAARFPAHFEEPRVSPKIEFLIGLLQNDPPATSYMEDLMRQERKKPA